MKNFIAILAVALFFAWPSYAADTKDSALSACASLAGTETMALVQSGGNCKQTLSGAATYNFTTSITNLTMATGGALRTSTSDTNTGLLQAYDVDGSAYKTFCTLTAGNTPSLACAAPSGGTYSDSPSTLNVPHSTSLPGTCAVGDSYMDTDATSGSRWYLCESANTWAVQGGGAGSVAGSFGITIDGGGSAITTGIKGYVTVPYGMTITGWDILGDQSGSMVVDVWKDTYANYPPTVADTIAGSEKPTLASAAKGQDQSLSSWTTAVTAGDVIGFKVDSATTVTRATVVIYGTRN